MCVHLYTFWPDLMQTETSEQTVRDFELSEAIPLSILSYICLLVECGLVWVTLKNVYFIILGIYGTSYVVYVCQLPNYCANQKPYVGVLCMMRIQSIIRKELFYNYITHVLLFIIVGFLNGELALYSTIPSFYWLIILYEFVILCLTQRKDDSTNWLSNLFFWW